MVDFLRFLYLASREKRGAGRGRRRSLYRARGSFLRQLFPQLSSADWFLCARARSPLLSEHLASHLSTGFDSLFIPLETRINVEAALEAWLILKPKYVYKIFL